MKYIKIEKTLEGWLIQDSITDIQIHYIGYTQSQAIQRHRTRMNIKYKHLEKIFIQGV